MAAIVVNRIQLSVPVASLVEVIEREFPPAFRAQPGFEGCTIVEAAPDVALVVIRWASAEDATRGAAAIGPTVFNAHIAPVALGQDRLVGPVVVDIPA